MTKPPFKTDPILSRNPLIAHGFFGRKGGVSRGIYDSLNVGIGSDDDPVSVVENRARVRAALGVDAMVSAYQVHGADVVHVTAPWPDAQRPHADALVTTRPGVALCILTADCVPILFADMTRPIIGAAHAGWKGALGGVCEATLAEMVALGADPASITAVIGPAIQAASYEVGPEFRARFVADDATNDRFFSSGNGDRLHFDLTGYVAQRLAQAGIGTVAGLGDDTCANPAYFSNRARTHAGEPDYGRNASVIAIV